MRPKFLLVTAVVLSSSVIYFNSCKKADTQDSPGTNKEINSKVNSWLDDRKSQTKPITNANIERLKKSMDFSRLRFEELNKDEDLLIIPINKDFKSIMNKDKYQINNLVLWINKSGTITKGNLVQFIPSDNQMSTTVPVNTFAKIFNGKNLDCDGKFVFLTAADWLLYELTFEKGKIHSYGVAKLKENRTSNARLETCILWYLTITLYYDDGSTEVYEYDLGIECFGEGVPEQPQGDEAGGGGPDCCFDDPNVNYSSSAISDGNGLNCGSETINPATGLPMKQCTYTWDYNTNSLLFYQWKYKSFERSDIEKVGTDWKFIVGGTTHTSSVLNGTLPPCVNFTHTVNSSIPSISADRRQAGMRLRYTNSFKITCWEWSPIRSETQTSEAFWPAP